MTSLPLYALCAIAGYLLHWGADRLARRLERKQYVKVFLDGYFKAFLEAQKQITTKPEA